MFKQRRRMWWAANNPQNPGGDPGAGGGGGTPTPPAAPGTQSGNGAGEEGSKTYTQAELDRMFGETRKQARKTALSELMGELGVKDADEIKGILTGHRQQQDKELSESQKLQKKVSEMEAERARLLGQLRGDQLMRLVEKAASALNFQDPEDAYLRLKDKLVLSESGDKIEGLEDALKQLAKDKPYLIKSAAGTAAPNINAVQNGAGQSGGLQIDEARTRKKFGLSRRRH